MLKRVGESRHPCRIPTVGRNDLQHDLTRIADKANGSVLLAQLQVAVL